MNSWKMPRKQRRAALRAALAAKQADGELMVLESLEVAEPKTRLVAELLRGLGLSGRVTLVTAGKNEALERGARNIPRVQVLRVGQFGVYDIVNGGRIVMAADAVKKIEELYGA